MSNIIEFYLLTVELSDIGLIDKKKFLIRNIVSSKFCFWKNICKHFWFEIWFIRHETEFPPHFARSWKIITLFFILDGQLQWCRMNHSEVIFSCFWKQLLILPVERVSRMDKSTKEKLQYWIQWVQNYVSEKKITRNCYVKFDLSDTEFRLCLVRFDCRTQWARMKGQQKHSLKLTK